MGRSCYVIRNDGGGIRETLAPNNQPSVLYQEALGEVGSPERAAAVWGTAYAPEFVRFFGDWISNPGEYDLDANGEPRYRDVMAFIRRKNMVAGDLMPEEVRDLGNTLTSLDAGDIEALAGMITSNFVSGGEVFLNARNLRDSGMYDDGEIRRIMSDRRIYDKVRSMMSRIVGYVADGNLTDRDRYFLSYPPSLGEDYLLYDEGYDALGKRRVVNPMDIHQTLMEVVGGVSDREEFDNRFLSVPYPALVERYTDDQDYADRMYDRYGNMTRMEVRGTSGEILTDSHSTGLAMYVTTGEVSSLRNRVGKIMNQDKIDRDELRELAIDLAGIGVDISDLFVDGMVVTDDDIRELMASLDIMLWTIERGDTDISGFSRDLDRLTGKGNPKYKVLDTRSGGDTMSYAKTGGETPPGMFDRGLLYMSRDVYHKTVRVGDRRGMYEELALAGIAEPSYLPAGVVPTGASRSDLDTVIDNLRKYVMAHTSSMNTEDMILTRLAYRHPVTPTMSEVDIDREFRRYKAMEGHDTDLHRDTVRLRAIWVRERIRNSDLYNNVLRYLEFGDNYTVSLSRYDGKTLRDIEMSLPEGEVKDLLFNIAVSSRDRSMTNLFYLDPVNGVHDTGFLRYLYRDNPMMLREANGGVEAVGDDTVKVRGRHDGFLTINSGLYEKVGEAKDGGIYMFAGRLSYSDPSSYLDSVRTEVGERAVRGDNTYLDHRDQPSAEIDGNEYTSGAMRLVEEYTCG